MDLDGINIEKNIRGGSNCTVYKGYYNSPNEEKDVVVKVMEASTETRGLMEIIKEDYLNIRERAKRKGVTVPVLYNCFILKEEEIPIKFKCNKGWSFIIVESYAGISLRDLIRTEIYPTIKTQKIIARCGNFIKKLPEDIPLDTNPGNILYSKIDSRLRYVDFLPPDPWLHIKDIILRKELEKIFPTLKNTLDDTASIDRYFNNIYRWEKFKYYTQKYSVTHELGVLP